MNYSNMATGWNQDNIKLSVICSRCEHELKGDENYCPNCGRKLAKRDRDLKKDEALAMLNALNTRIGNGAIVITQPLPVEPDEANAAVARKCPHERTDEKFCPAYVGGECHARIFSNGDRAEACVFNTTATSGTEVK